jgi:hypothetical protein
MRPFDLFPALLAAAILASASAPALTAPATYPILDDARAFRGRITYIAHRIDAVAVVPIAGDLTIGDTFWTLDERTSETVATAGSNGASLQGGGLSTGVDDPLAAGAVNNAWAVAMGTLARSGTAREGQSDAVWRVAALRLYLDDARARVVGLVDTAGPGNVSFAFDDWTDVNGLRLPTRVMRLRDDVPEASYAIEGYRVLRAPGVAALPASHHAVLPDGLSGTAVIVAAQSPIQLDPIEFPWRLLLAAFGALSLAICLVAWTRRDAFIEALRRRVEDDPRGWHTRGSSSFVSADGRLWFDGAEYRVGPQFYGRSATVQSSPLFLRVGARDVPCAVVLARKFRPAHRTIDRSAKADRRPTTDSTPRRSSAGLSLIENIIALGLFSMVVVGAVYPTLIVMADGDRLARTQSNAVRLAENALGDEEAACAYGSVIDGSVRTKSGDLTTIVTVEASQTGTPGAQDIDVVVEDASGRTLAHALSTVGPAVPAPPPPGATPTPHPVQSSTPVPPG